MLEVGDAMTTSAPVRAAFESLIDYAGLFPPAALPMAGAVAEYAEALRGEHAWMLGRFIVPASRIAELGDFGREHGLCAIVNVSALVLNPSEDTTRWFNAVSEILNGVALSPLLLVRDGTNVVIADGYHRLCAVYTFDEDASVPCKIV